MSCYSGKEFNAKFGDKVLLKFLPKTMDPYGFKWKLGLNEDIHEFDPRGCVPGGLHCCFENHAAEWTHMGTRVFRVRVPDDAEVAMFMTKIKASSLILVEEVRYHRGRAFNPLELFSDGIEPMVNLFDAWIKYQKTFGDPKPCEIELYWVSEIKRSRPIMIDVRNCNEADFKILTESIYDLMKFFDCEAPPVVMSEEDIKALEKRLGAAKFMELLERLPESCTDKFIQLKLKSDRNFFIRSENDLDEFYTFKAKRYLIQKVFEKNVDRYINMGFGHHIFFAGEMSYDAWKYFTRERGLKVLTRRVPDFQVPWYRNFVHKSEESFTTDDWKLILQHYPGLIVFVKEKLTYELVELVSKAPASEFEFLDTLRNRLFEEFKSHGFRFPGTPKHWD